MRKKIFQLLFVFLGCLHLTGGPYSLIQGYAWVTMLVNYSQDGGILQATRDTFSGEKPCELCTMIASARDSGEHPQTPLAPNPLSSKLLQEMLPGGETILRTPRARELAASTFAQPLPAKPRGPASPPIPPPRAAV